MKRIQYLLIKLAEEASEVSQIALKTSQFGMEETCPGLLENNKQRIHSELNDLFGIIEMLNDEFNFEFKIDSVKSNLKRVKVNKYYEYSKEQGMIHEKNITD